MFVTLNRIRHSESSFTLTELVFVFCITVLFILLLTPFINKIRCKAEIITCEENIQKMAVGLNLYADEHRGKFPESLEELLENGYVADEMIFDCPSSPHMGTAKDPDYNYATGFSILSPSDTAIIYDKPENHKNGRHVLYINGNILLEETN